MVTNATSAVFPGQGSQYLGMGRYVYEISIRVRDIFSEASDVLGWDVWRLCDQGPEVELNDTSRAQPAIYTLSYAMYRLLHDAGWEPGIVAGHSLGEFTALTAADVLPFRDCLLMVAKRGDLMSQAAKAKPGAMLAVLGADTKALEKRIRTLGRFGVIEIANYNCPGQVVVSLERGLLDQAKEELALLAKRVVELPVSGAFHSSLMKEVQGKFAQFVSAGTFRFHRPKVPILLNTTLAPSFDPVEIREALIAQMTLPVRWQQAVTQMIRLGFGAFVEVGPKDVLTKLIMRIDRSCLALATDGRDPREIIGVLEVSNGA